jgi:hypothetical protein
MHARKGDRCRQISKQSSSRSVHLLGPTQRAVTRLHSCLVPWRAPSAAAGRFHGERLASPCRRSIDESIDEEVQHLG